MGDGIEHLFNVKKDGCHLAVVCQLVVPGVGDM